MDIVLAITAYVSFIAMYYLVETLVLIKLKSNKAYVRGLAILTWLICLMISAYVGEFIPSYSLVGVLMFLASFVFLKKAQQTIRR